jgi:hypothetical protein
MLAAAVVLAVLAAVTDAGPNPYSLALFIGLMLWAENSGVWFGSIARVSPAFMVVMGYIAGSGSDAVVLGAAILGLANGIGWDNLRKRKFHNIAFNCAESSLSSAAAAFAFTLAAPSYGATPLAVCAAAVAYAVVNIGFVLPSVALEDEMRFREVWRIMAPTTPSYIAFGVLGALVGALFEGLGAVSIALLIVPIAIARTTFLAVLELQHAREATINVFSRAIAAKDEYTARHTERVAKYCLYIGEKLGLSPARMEHLYQAAMMHDIGKLAVPKHLLNKPAKLTDEEFRQVQRHAHVCIDILGLVDFLKPMTAAAAGHHSRYDGGGYGGTGEHPLEAYICAVADSYDAMTSTRSYRRALPQEVAFAELRDKSGSQFHPDCVEALISALEERGERHGLGYEENVVAFEVAPPVVGVGSAGLGDLASEEPAPEREAPQDVVQ